VLRKPNRAINPVTIVATVDKESAITFSPRDKIRDWFEATIGEAEDM